MARSNSRTSSIVMSSKGKAERTINSYQADVHMGSLLSLGTVP